jgi:hypothetical protein
MRARIVVLLITITNIAVSQTTKPDSAFMQVAHNQAVVLYEQAFRTQAHVYEGAQYIGHNPRIQIHPYYLIDSTQTGTIVYNEVQYRNVGMLYDIVRDELVVNPPLGGYRLRLRTDKIAQFTLGQHQFARILGDSVAGIQTGFYEIIYNGKVKALAKRQKIIQEDISGGVYKADFLPKDRFVIQKDGAFYEVKTKRSVLNLFPDQAKELRQYLRKNKLKFREQQREEAIARAVQRYDELTH